jgi:hypothetical protein
MRNLVVASILAVSSVIGLGLSPAAKAGDARIFVDLGNVYFSAGQPYYRETRQPLYVAHYAYGPRYYYSRPAYGYRHYDRGHSYNAGYRYRDHDGYRGRDGYRGHDGYRGRDGHRGDDHRRGHDDSNQRGDRGRNRR